MQKFTINKLDDVMATIAPLMRNDIAFDVKRKNFFCRNVTMDWWPEATEYQVTPNADGNVINPQTVFPTCEKDFGITQYTFSLKKVAINSRYINIAPDRPWIEIHEDLKFTQRELTSNLKEMWEPLLQREYADLCANKLFEWPTDHTWKMIKECMESEGVASPWTIVGSKLSETCLNLPQGFEFQKIPFPLKVDDNGKRVYHYASDDSSKKKKNALVCEPCV